MCLFNCKPCDHHPLPPTPCPSCEVIDFYAQYGVQANPPSGSDLPMNILFQEKNKIHLNGNTEIILSPGYLYLIDYLFLATPEANGYMQIVPRINETFMLLYSFFAPANSQERNASASGSFTTNAASSSEASLSFTLTYPGTVRNIDISGAISVTPLLKI